MYIYASFMLLALSLSFYSLFLLKDRCLYAVCVWYMCLFVRAQVCICVFTCMCACAHVCMCACVYVHVCVYVCHCVRVCVFNSEKTDAYMFGVATLEVLTGKCAKDIAEPDGPRSSPSFLKYWKPSILHGNPEIDVWYY